MCGISGVYNYNQGHPVSDTLLQSMLMAMHHRGPDEDGVFIEDELAIGMRRLSIIDLAGGTQPIYNEDHRYVLVFNGEIYNHLELRDTLKKQGHQFRSDSDTEVIVHLYEQHGADCVKHLRGMFAFALWDKEEKRLMVARDHLGIKPLYYFHQG
ncbi:MAG: asparagine synthetase B, partial [Aggregatilineales bacterium]